VSVELDELKAEHERIKLHHTTYIKRKKIIDIIFYLSLVGLAISWLFYPSATSEVSVCTTTFCVMLPWVAIILAILCAIFFGLSARHLTRGINAYHRAMGTLTSLRGSNN